MTDEYKPLQTSTHYMEGYFSYKEDVGEAYNPYELGSTPYLNWRLGWYAAKKDVKPPIWRSSAFWSGMIFILLGIVVVSFEVPVVRENPRFLGAAFATYGIGSILLKAISGQTNMQPIIIPPMFHKWKSKKKDTN
jgi:hypothetical protein